MQSSLRHRWIVSFSATALLAACVASAAFASPQGIPPVPGDLAISEILFDSATAVDDNDGEYFEVTNISMKALDLSGLYVQDLETAGSTTAPYVVIPSGALPALFPGQSFVFARSADPAVNGAIPVVHYAYAVPTGGTVPTDHSKVSHSGMALSNSSIDAIFITSGAPANLGGFVIEGVTYDPTKAPLTNHAGVGFERGNLMAPWQESNVAASAITFGSAQQKGTPGAMNSNDATLYSTWTKYDAISPTPADVAVLTAVGPASVSGGWARLRLSGGPPGAGFAIGYSTAPAQAPLFGGTALIDFGPAHFWSNASFALDPAGKASFEVPLTPQLLGAQAYVQWFAFDAATGLVFSNGLSVDICP